MLPVSVKGHKLFRTFNRNEPMKTFSVRQVNNTRSSQTFRRSMFVYICDGLLQALISEKSMELERLRIQYQSLQKTEMEQQETIQRLVLHR
jgi:hypothetical protein